MAYKKSKKGIMLKKENFFIQKGLFMKREEMRVEEDSMKKQLVYAFCGLLLAPLAPVFFTYQWLFIKDHDYVIERKEKRKEIMRRFFCLIGILFIAWMIFIIINSFPDSDVGPIENRGEACFPYGNCY